MEDIVDSSRRAAGWGLLAYGLVTPVAFMATGAPGGEYKDATVTSYATGTHSVLVALLAYAGAFAALGLLPYVRHLRKDCGETLWALGIAAVTTGVIGWFLVAGLQISFAEGGDAVRAMPHPVIYAISEMSNLVAVCASAFFVGASFVVLARRGPLPRSLRVVAYVAAICGMTAALFFTAFLFWLGTMALGVWAISTARRVPADAAGTADQPQFRTQLV